MARFRAPTRFLVVVELGLVLLGAIGLTRVGAELKQRWSGASRMPRLIQIGICVVTALDLLIHQPRQNPFVPAREWLAPPRTADIVRADSAAPRTFTPHHRDIHRRVHVGPPRGGRTSSRTSSCATSSSRTRAPATGTCRPPTATSALRPAWYVTIWSYHYFENSLIHDRARQAFEEASLIISPPFVTLMRTFGVTHVLGPYPATDPKLNPERDPTLKLIAREPNVYIYRVEGSARVRVVRAARRLGTEALAVARLRDLTFDPDREIVLQDAPDSVHPTIEEAGEGPPDVSPGRAAIVRESSRELVVEATASRTAFCCSPTRIIQAGTRRWMASRRRSIAPTSASGVSLFPKDSTRCVSRTIPSRFFADSGSH